MNFKDKYYCETNDVSMPSPFKLFELEIRREEGKRERGRREPCCWPWKLPLQVVNVVVTVVSIAVACVPGLLLSEIDRKHSLMSKG